MSKFCANCGQEVPEGINCCTKCGASLNTEQNNTNNYYRYYCFYLHFIILTYNLLYH